MAENKIFAGARIRRMRTGLGLTQTAMAEALGVSPSYLNLIERNQRPLTVQLILRLSRVYDVEIGDLQGGDRQALLAELKATFADPLLSGELPGGEELAEIADAAPNAAAGIAKLYRAYREQQGRLTDLSELLAREGRGLRQAGRRLPNDEVREVLEKRPNHFAAIEVAAERLHQTLAPGEDLMGALQGWLRSEHDIAVRMLPTATMPNWRRRFDRHSRRLFLAERLTAADRLRETATEACLLAFGDVIEAENRSFAFSTEEAHRLGRVELLRYAAHALMLPYGPFQAAAEKASYDIDLLVARFQVSIEQVATRLTTLQRQSAPGVPFFMLEIDHAGNRLRRAGARGFPTQRFGGGCPKLPIHATFSQPGQSLVETAEMPDGARFLLIARTVDGLQAGFEERPRRTAVLLGCDIQFADRTVYGRVLASNAAPTRIGPVCRLCERQGCLARAEPPLTRPLKLDESVAGLGAFDFL